MLRRREADEFTGTVSRLGRRSLVSRLDAGLPLLTNVKLRLRYPHLGRESGDLYGKVVGTAPEPGRPTTSIRLTSVDSDDQTLIETVLAS